jgi:hypothetical protein
MYLRTDCLRGCVARISFMITLFQIKERNEEFNLEPVENLFKFLLKANKQTEALVQKD